MSEIEEMAKATQEVAKSTHKALDISQQFGGFISKYIGGTLEQGLGIWEDKLKYMRWENQLNLIDKANRLLSERDLLDNIEPLPLKIAIPIFEKASLEDNTSLQDLWTKLLVNSVTPNTSLDLSKTYINILDQLSPLEAKTLMTIYNLKVENINSTIETYKLPDECKIHISENSSEPSISIQLVLENLLRLGCISLDTFTVGGGQEYALIHQTLLGQKLTASLK